MSEVNARMYKQQQDSEQPKQGANPKTSKAPIENDHNQGSSSSLPSSKQPLLREQTAEQAHEEDTAGCLCPIFAHLPHFHWSKKKERTLAGDQFAYDIYHNPREELDESSGRGRRGCDCNNFCNCPGAWRWWPGWGGN